MIATRLMAEAAADSDRAAPSAPTGCAHCGEPLPADAPRDADGHAYCCAGCRTVRALLRQSGLDDYYRVRAASELAACPTPVASPRLHSEFDAHEFLSRHAVVMVPDRWRIDLRIDGLRCGACIWLLEALPRLADGVLEVRIDAGRSIASIDWMPSRITLSQVAHWVERLGYRLLPLRDRRERERDRRADRAWLVRLGTAGVLSANAMGIAFALYGGVFHGMDPSLRIFLQWVSMALAAVSVLGPGRLFLTNAWLAIRSRAPHMDLPISLALVAALIGGVASTLRGGHGVYAESVTMLVLLLLAGRFVQFRSQLRARHQVDLLATLIPGIARRVLPSGVHEEVPVEALRPGDQVLVPAGEAACADGRVVDGACWVDMQALTGESRPVHCEIGETLPAGCRPVDRPVLVDVIEAGERTRAGRLMAMVDSASSRRAPVVQFANRIAGWFLAGVLALAALTLVLWWHAGASVALEHMVALLVVTCPCALGLATPLTMVASIAKAARAGILIKGGDVMERLASRGTIVLDKTGTLTEGRMRVVEHHGDAHSLRLAARLESRSAHPIARAIAALHEATGAIDGSRADALRREEHPAAIDEVREVAGRGIIGTVAGVRVAVGRLTFAGAESASGDWVELERAIAMRGLTPVAIAIDGSVRAMVGVGDPIRTDALATIRQLRRRGWRTIMASGDDARVAASVGAAVGIPACDIHGGQSPEQKLALVSSRQFRQPLVMVGDGVNDVAAMAASDVGVSIGGGTRASLEVGDACLARDGIRALPPLIDGAARTMRIVYFNFGIGLAYNLVGASLAMAGVMNPLIAAVLMPLSGLMVTTIALRAPRFGSTCAVRSRHPSRGDARLDATCRGARSDATPGDARLAATRQDARSDATRASGTREMPGDTSVQEPTPTMQPPPRTAGTLAR